MPKLNIDQIPSQSQSGYPSEFLAMVAGRSKKRLGDAGGLTQFGVNLTELEPGAYSAARHWHENEDEFIYIISGELTLIDDAGETLLQAGDCAAFGKGDPNGHHLKNKSNVVARYLEIGTRASSDHAHYPDIDLAFIKNDNEFGFFHKDGHPYKETQK